MAEKTKIDMDDVNNLDIGEEKGGILKKLNSSTIHMIVDALGFLFMFVYFKGQNSSLKQEIISLRREFEDFQNQTKSYIRYLGSRLIPENEIETKQSKKSVRFSGRDEYKEIPEESVEEEPQTQHRPQSYPQPQQMKPQQQRLPSQPQNQSQRSQPTFQPQETKQPQFQPQEIKQFQPQQSQEIKEPIKFEQPKMELPQEELPRVGPEENTTSLPETEDFSDELKDEFISRSAPGTLHPDGSGSVGAQSRLDPAPVWTGKGSDLKRS